MDFTRDELRALHTRSSTLGAALLVCDLAGYAICAAGVAYERWWLLQMVFAGVATIFVGRLFTLGHDACHQSLTPTRWLNRVLGMIALAVSFHPYSLWDLGHNRIHHRYTNLRGLDYVWEPLDPEEYAQLSSGQRRRYRFYRTVVGHFFYYSVEIWWRKMFFPRPSEIGGYRQSYVWDHVFVAAYIMALAVGLVALRGYWVAPLTLSSAIGVVAWAIAVPVGLFHLSMSTIIYLHHTHPRVTWARQETATTEGQIAGAVHVVLPGFLARTLHHIMDHTAHHARPGIPLYNLAQGQTILESNHENVIVEPWTLKQHLDTLRRCKLFDLDRGEWVPFANEASEGS
jgi:omega-6 fatty acid desaturase (delta-12 desaturase)